MKTASIRDDLKRMDAAGIAKAVDAVRSALVPQVDMGIILGSGLGGFVSKLEDTRSLPFGDIPGMPAAKVAGHQGALVVGRLPGASKLCAVFAGRVHAYEGHHPSVVALPVRILKGLRAHTVVVTNAAGAIREGFAPGDAMVLSDHINQMGIHPLVGANEPELGCRFPDMSAAYDLKLQNLLQHHLGEAGVKTHRGVYAAMLGPSYETPAEVRMLRILGADAVGMSTVPEVIAARHAGLKVGAVSLLSNLAAGVGDEVLAHQEVTAMGAQMEQPFCQALAAVAKEILA